MSLLTTVGFAIPSTILLALSKDRPGKRHNIAIITINFVQSQPVFKMKKDKKVDMKVLIAEKDPIAADALRAALYEQGYEVMVTGDGGEAWRVLQTDVFSLVILGWIMPEMSGLEVCRNIRAHLKAPYRCIIMLTAKQECEERARALSAGADVFLPKPFECADIKARLQIARRILKLEQSASPSYH